jgi:hypothetical protein
MKATRFAAYFGIPDTVQPTAAFAFVGAVLTEHGLDAFNLQHRIGYWQGKPEASFVVEHYSQGLPALAREAFRRLAHRYAVQYSQQSVLVTETEVSHLEFIT